MKKYRLNIVSVDVKMEAGKLTDYIFHTHPQNENREVVCQDGIDEEFAKIMNTFDGNDKGTRLYLEWEDETIIKFNYKGVIHIVELDKLAKEVPLFAIIEVKDWFKGKTRFYECHDVEGKWIDHKKPIPIELYNKQINISHGAGRGG